MFNKRCIFGECGRNPPKYIVKVTAEPSDFQTVAGGVRATPQTDSDVQKYPGK